MHDSFEPQAQANMTGSGFFDCASRRSVFLETFCQAPCPIGRRAAGWTVAIALLAGPWCAANQVRAGVMYTDPPGGWRYSYQGTFNPGVEGLPPGYGKSDDSEALDGTWVHDQGGDKWDGTAPGDPLSDPNVDPTGTSPGGAGAFVENSTNYIRVQDTGQPDLHGWVQGDDPINHNRRVFFAHDMTQEGSLPSQLVLDDGMTISFRARVPNSGPLDDLYTVDGQGAPEIQPWLVPPADPVGRGIPIYNDGKGMFNVIQNDNGLFGFNQDSSIGFSLMTSADVAGLCSQGPVGDLADHCSAAAPGKNPRGGLIMNNLVGPNPSDDVDTFDFLNPGFAGQLNLLELDDDQIHEFREFWITIEAENSPGTHRVDVYVDGSTDANTFHVTTNPDGQSGYDDGAFLTFGIGTNVLFGAFDMDFFSYTLGVVTPEAAQVAGDMDCDGDVDFDDIDAMVLALRRPEEYESTYGVPAELKGDLDGDGDLDFDDVDPGFIDILRGGLRAVPEPSGGSLMLACCLAALPTVWCRIARPATRRRPNGPFSS